MDENEKILVIERILENSDIVWSRYGTETIEELAKRILNHLSQEQ